MKEQAKLHFANLDILRFTAAFYVLAAHIFDYTTEVYKLPSWLFKNGENSYPENLNTLGSFVNMFLKNGSFGVDMFFLISGFLITSLLLREKSNSLTIDIKSFYIRRILRIWPLYYFIVFFAFGFAKLYTHEEMHLRDLIPHLFFVGNFSMIQALSWCSGKLFILWSICIEEHFYLIIPILLFLVPIKRQPWLFAALVLISIITRIILFKSYEYPWFPIYLHTFARFDVLAIGCLLGWLNFSQVKFKLPVAFRWVLLVGLFIFMGVFSVRFYDTFFYAVFFKYFYIIPSAILFYDLVINVLPTFSSMFNNFFNRLGKYSYGIYMYHPFAIIFCNNLANQYFNQSKIAFALLSILCTASVAFFSYEVFEKHFLKLKSRFEKI